MINEAGKSFSSPVPTAGNSEWFAQPTPRPPAKSSPLRRLVAACIVLAGFGYISALWFSVLTDKIAADKDFIAYWAAGQQLVRGANPYDEAAVGALQRAIGGTTLNLMRNPPDAFFLVLPLGLFSAKTGLLLWQMALLASLSVSLWMIWRLNGRPNNRLHLLGFLFAPALICLFSGQVGIFLLLGLVLFLSLHRNWPFLAGSALLLCAFKPHLFLSFFTVHLLWALIRKNYRILAGFAAALLASCALSFSLAPHAWAQYSRLISTGGALNERIPTLSVAISVLLDRHATWMQFTPAALACAWATWFFWTRRNRWDWMDHGLLVLLVSVLCTPYGWITDESILLPAILTGLYRVVRRRLSPWPLALVASAALLEFFVADVKINSFYYLWTAPTWLAWYLYANHTGQGHPEESRPEPAPVG